ncbi:MAG: hypothetical protein IJ877_01690, partial [Candidatus Gastranaerophilales bacterium]|nr:hypothetical protein [Candidatus Gastranaerophilales bacterium]
KVNTYGYYLNGSAYVTYTTSPTTGVNSQNGAWTTTASSTLLPDCIGATKVNNYGYYLKCN